MCFSLQSPASIKQASVCTNKYHNGEAAPRVGSVVVVDVTAGVHVPRIVTIVAVGATQPYSLQPIYQRLHRLIPFRIIGFPFFDEVFHGHNFARPIFYTFVGKVINLFGK